MCGFKRRYAAAYCSWKWGFVCGKGIDESRSRGGWKKRRGPDSADRCGTKRQE